MGELSTAGLANFEVYRSGAHVALRCIHCKMRWPWPAKIELLKLVRIAGSHVCDGSIPKVAAMTPAAGVPAGAGHPELDRGSRCGAGRRASPGPAFEVPAAAVPPYPPGGVSAAAAGQSPAAVVHSGPPGAECSTPAAAGTGRPGDAGGVPGLRAGEHGWVPRSRRVPAAGLGAVDAASPQGLLYGWAIKARSSALSALDPDWIPAARWLGDLVEWLEAGC